MKFHIVENAQLVQALAPAADAAGRAGQYITLKGASRLFIVVNITQGNAATIALTPYQATAIAGTGEKVLAGNMPIWSNLDTSVNDTLTRRTDAANYTTDAALKNKVIVFQIDSSALDVSGGFDCVTVKTGASNAANITAAMYHLTGDRYQQATAPSAILD